MPGTGPYQTIDVVEARETHRLTLRRPFRDNAIDAVLLAELHRALDRAEQAAECRIVQLQGSDGIFCSGMDFHEVARQDLAGGDDWSLGGAAFLGLLKRFTTIPRIIISWVDGRASGGGVGLAAASDFVFASARAEFALPEALWGLLPCCVLPFLIRRTGFQQAYVMALGTQPVTAAQAERFHLVDVVTDSPARAIRPLAFRAARLEESTIADLKRYFRRMWFTGEETDRAAVAEFSRLISDPRIRQRIADFVTLQRYPWERDRGQDAAAGAVPDQSRVR